MRDTRGKGRLERGARGEGYQGVRGARGEREQEGQGSTRSKPATW